MGKTGLQKLNDKMFEQDFGSSVRILSPSGGPREVPLSRAEEASAAAGRERGGVSEEAGRGRGRPRRRSDGGGDLVNLNFRVPAEFHRRAKMFAAEHDLLLVDMLVEAFELYYREHGAERAVR